MGLLRKLRKKSGRKRDVAGSSYCRMITQFQKASLLSQRVKQGEMAEINSEKGA
jgi:hypothetical protein